MSIQEQNHYAAESKEGRFSVYCAAHHLIHAVPFVAADGQEATAGEPGTETTDRSGVPDLPGKRHPDPRRRATQLPSGSAWMDGAAQLRARLSHQLR